MTSELRVDNLKGSTTGGSINVLGEGTSATTNLQQGLAKAWVNFDGGSVDSGTDLDGVQDSFNIASVVDNNTGNHTMNLTNSFSNTNYNATALTGTGGALRNISVNTTVTMTSSSFSVFTGPSNGTATGDCDFVYVTFHGDLA